MTMTSYWLTFLCVSALTISTANAQHAHDSQYAGQETREIKSLSPSDIEELERGGGWGLAKAAELNGVPGPIHLLDAKAELALDDAQVAAITAIYEQMRSQAIEQGERLISLERVLERHFRDRTINEQILRSSLDAIATARKELRYIHLSAHLKTPEILSDEQIERYNSIRGYHEANPCDSVPDGHDPVMWRKHNGCE